MACFAKSVFSSMLHLYISVFLYYLISIDLAHMGISWQGMHA